MKTSTRCAFALLACIALSNPLQAAPPPEDLFLYARFWTLQEVGAEEENYRVFDLLCLLAGGCDVLPPCTLCDEVVSITDPDLEAGIRLRLNKPTGDLCKCDMARLVRLSFPLNSGTNSECPGDIGSLGGLEHAINLEHFSLGCGFVGDLSPLAGLVKLKTVYVHDNFAPDLNFVQNLVNLEVLDLFRNNINIVSLGPLAGKTQLRALTLPTNAIVDLAPLAGLTTLEELNLEENAIIDISPLTGLVNLRNLFLANNQIADLSPLSGSNKLEQLDLGTNLIADIDPLENLVELKRLFLGANQIESISATAGLTQLVELILVENQIVELGPLSGLVNLTQLLLGSNQIVDLEPLTGLINMVEIDVSDNLISDLSPLSGMTQLVRLPASVNLISDLSPLTPLVNLTILELNGNLLTGLETLPALPELTFLGLARNDISILSSGTLSGLPKLRTITIDENHVTDLSAIAMLPNLETLSVRENGISTLTSLPAVQSLRVLLLENNAISDLSILTALPELHILGLGNNMISDISHLSGLTSLRSLNLGANLIVDPSPIVNLVNLVTLELDDNFIATVEAFANLSQLTTLSIERNLITDLRPLVDSLNFGRPDLFFIPRGNPLTFEAACVQIPQLEERGIDVLFNSTFDCRTPTPTQDPSIPTATPPPSGTPTSSRTPTETRTPTATFTQGGDVLTWARGVGDTSASDLGYSVAALEDGSGFVATGTFGGTVIIGASEPNETMLTSMPGALGPSGDVFVAKYNADGSVVWAKQSGGSGFDQGLSIAVRTDGGCYVAGSIADAMFVSSYANDGSLLWTRGSGGTGTDQGDGVAVLPDQTVVVCGRFQQTLILGESEPGQQSLESAGNFDIFAARYNSSGDLMWAKSAGGVEWDEGMSIDALGNSAVVLTGRFGGVATFGPGEAGTVDLSANGNGDNSPDVFLARYNTADGTLVWAKRAGSGSDEMGRGVSARDENEIYVVGDLRGLSTYGPGEPGSVQIESQGNSDIFLARYNGDGSVAWVRSAGSEDPDIPYGVTALPSGGAALTGEYQGTCVFARGEPNQVSLIDDGTFGEGTTEAFFARYASDGGFITATRAGGPNSETGRGIAALSDSDVFSTGYFGGSSTFGPGESNETILDIGGTSFKIFFARHHLE